MLVFPCNSGCFVNFLEYRVTARSGTGCFRRLVWASLLHEVLGLCFVLLYLSGGPGANAPGFAQQGLLFPEGGKVVGLVGADGLSLLMAPQSTQPKKPL